MIVELGNPAPHHSPNDGPREALPGPAVTYLTIPDDYSVGSVADVATIQRHIGQATDGITNLPEHEALLCVVHPGGVWAAHGSQPPAWVWSDNDELAAQLGAYYGCPVGRPDDVEDSHHTLAGPPGVGPAEHVDDPTSSEENV